MKRRLYDQKNYTQYTLHLAEKKEIVFPMGRKGGTKRFPKWSAFQVFHMLLYMWLTAWSGDGEHQSN